MKKKSILIMALLTILSLKLSLNAQVAVNTTGEAPNTSAMLDIKSSDKGILIPRMTKAARDAITVSSEQNGLLIYQTDNTPGFYFYDGSDWVVVGDGATSINSLYDGKSDGNSVYLGIESGDNVESGFKYNASVGVWSLKEVISGSHNSAFGTTALQQLTTGSQNTSFGMGALSALTTTSNNTAVGKEAGKDVTGSGNVFIGNEAAKTQTSISNKLFVDNTDNSTPLIYGEFDNDLLRVYGTFDINNAYQFPTSAGTNGQLLKTDGSGNLSWADDTNTGATGIDGLTDGKTGGFNLFLGEGAGTNHELFNNYNTGIGLEALYSNTIGESNTAIGFNAGKTNVGSGNIFIGAMAGYSETGSNKLYIENTASVTPLIYGDFNTNLLRINGTLNINNAFQFPTAAGTNGQLLKTDGSGNLSWADDIGSASIDGLSDGRAGGNSVFLGLGAGYIDDFSNNENTSVGDYSLFNNTSGYSNTAIGYASMLNMVEGDENVAIGNKSLYNANSSVSIGNTAIGFSALYNNTQGHNNIAIGYKAGYNETGSNKLYIENSSSSDPLIYGSFYSNLVKINGTLELYNFTSASSITFFEPSGSGSNYTTFQSQSQSDNVIYTLPSEDGTSGYVLQTNGSGVLSWISNTGPGSISIDDLSDASTDATCIFLGDGTGINDDGTANKNTALGIDALNQITSGYENIAVGHSALNLVSTGHSNVAIGINAGLSTTGHSNIFLGANAGSNESGSNKLYIENSNSITPLIYGEFDNDLVRINGDLEVTGSLGEIDDLSDAKTVSTSVYLGPFSGNSDIGNNYNTAVGQYSLTNNVDGSRNCAFGYQALDQNTSGNDNTATGVQALLSNTSGYDNTAVGREALKSNTTGHHNVAIGRSALDVNFDGSDNTAVGADAMGSNTSASDNTAVGRAALMSNTTGNWNCAVGKESLQANTTASENTAIGGQALSNNTTGHYNVAIGRAALDVNIDGSDNTAVGADAMGSNTSASDNTAVGREALKSNTTGHHNVAIGRSALDVNIDGSDNTAVGADAMGSNTSASDNTAIGREALKSNTTGNENTAIGSEALRNSTEGYGNSGVGELSLQNNTVGHHNTAIGRYALTNTTDGNNNTAVGVHSGVPTYGQSYSNTGAFGYEAIATASDRIRLGNSSITHIGGQVGWSTYSDKRFKRNVNNNVPGLDFILKLKPVSYNWDIKKLDRFIGATKGTESGEQMREARRQQEAKVYTGFLAQDVEAAAQDIGYNFSGVETPPNESTPYSLRYAEFVVPLVKAVQEQQDMIENQIKEKEEMQKQINALLKRIENLERK